MNAKSRARNFSAAAALPARIAACSAFAAASTACLALGGLRLLPGARRGLALAFFGADFLAAGFARFTTLVGFAKAFLLKDHSATVQNTVQARQMFLACFVKPQIGFVDVLRYTIDVWSA